MIKVTHAARTFGEKFKEVRAEVNGVARSRARMVKQAADIPGVLSDVRPAVPAATRTGVRMLDGNPMVFFTDGSLRHAMGQKPGKAARKALKRYRQARARQARS